MQKGITERKQEEKGDLFVKVRVSKDGYGRLLQLVGNDQAIAADEMAETLGQFFDQINPSNVAYDGGLVGAIARAAAQELEKRGARV